ncbi:MAG: sigma-54-dependent Fis family transcriptional regulator [Myxococcales bacterium]|nr:sigma-54-dependent Fis family transcriptional regulator [Myxococcales bacterium]
MLNRVVLALDRTDVARRLRKRVEQDDVVVTELKNGADIWDKLTRQSADAVLVSRTMIPDPAVQTVEAWEELPDAPALMVLTDDDNEDEHVQLQAAGAAAVVGARVSLDSMASLLFSVLSERDELAQERLATRRALTQPRLSDFVSTSGVMQAFVRTVERVIDSNVSLLILGETGVGKERLAQAVHYEGPRKTGPFIAINCGALPETLLESELFGHEEGAFTGAIRSRRGCFELAHHGTVFLDEIGELPHHLQVKLLRVLQEREVRRVGGERSIKVDVRVMAATNRDLKALIEQGLFRQDLYYRLSVMTLEIPPLRERREDIRELVRTYIDYLRPRVGRDVYGIRADAMHAMAQYRWPGNVRELINVIERAMLLAEGEEIGLVDLPQSVAVGREPSEMIMLPPPGAALDDLPPEWLERPWKDVRREAVERIERAYLKGLLEETKGKVGETARRAGMQPRSLFEKMQYYQLRKEDFR